MSDKFKISFNQFQLRSVSFNVNDEFKTEGTIEISPEFGIGHHYDKEKKMLHSFLKVALTKGNLPFYFVIEAVGLFSFNEALTDEKVLKNVSTINAPAIMFPYVRETIADLTRRAGFAPLHLDPVNFVNLAKQMTDQQQSAKKAKKVK